MPDPDIIIAPATRADVPIIHRFVTLLAEYEKLSDQMVATEAMFADTLFGDRPYAEVLIARYRGEPAGFALFFHNYSTWLAKPGIYLEDLFVLPELRGKGIGKALLVALAKVASARDCGRMEWSVLDWNTPSIEFYESLGAVRMKEWNLYRLTAPGIAKLAE
ncbi:GNAT family N-acetyltransferase [Humisphaera borealis]|uniref:GNAT family N-acetyltransferase n=1 Tax=Humisphaera borealis TaxID=2807512 RepID=A0A7M2WUU1_9BACT|nr:GNAT family N-acetyltransferase [Humisphaera borealis]QOV88310.1 GNAT family N-acetyltransferase [Humisphaera borealis]